jgi:hypothetical protein
MGSFSSFLSVGLTAIFSAHMSLSELIIRIIGEGFGDDPDPLSLSNDDLDLLVSYDENARTALISSGVSCRKGDGETLSSSTNS